MSKEEREKYDKLKMSADMRNSLLLWAVIMVVGGVLSYFFSFYFAIAALVLWLILFLKKLSCILIKRLKNTGYKHNAVHRPLPEI